MMMFTNKRLPNFVALHCILEDLLIREKWFLFSASQYSFRNIKVLILYTFGLICLFMSQKLRSWPLNGHTPLSMRPSTGTNGCKYMSFKPLNIKMT